MELLHESPRHVELPIGVHKGIIDVNNAINENSSKEDLVAKVEALKEQSISTQEMGSHLVQSEYKGLSAKISARHIAAGTVELYYYVPAFVICGLIALVTAPYFFSDNKSNNEFASTQFKEFRKVSKGFVERLALLVIGLPLLLVVAPLRGVGLISKVDENIRQNLEAQKQKTLKIAEEHLQNQTSQ